MSVTLTTKPKPDERSDSHDFLDRVGLDGDGNGPEDVFDAFVFYHPDVCSNCFTEVKREGVKTLKAIHGFDDVDKGTKTWPVGSEPQHPHTPLRAYPHRTTCANCGSVGCAATNDPLSTADALDRVPRLAEILDRHGFAFDVNELYRTVQYCKSDSDKQSYDTDIYRHAVRRAIQRAHETL